MKTPRNLILMIAYLQYIRTRTDVQRLMKWNPTIKGGRDSNRINQPDMIKKARQSQAPLIDPPEPTEDPSDSKRNPHGKESPKPRAKASARRSVR